ncbi:MAG: DUF5989 family protein [Pirellulaceae bacterium]|nr:DUF5989 family protein [Pirellulaceae bacterium]
MANESQPDRPEGSQDFAQQAQGASPGLVREFVDFLRYNKKWWLTPIILVLLGVALLVLLTSSPAAPFIYTLF